MICQDCRNHTMELFPATRYDHAERAKENVLLCIHCVPKCEYVAPIGIDVQRCGEPRDHRSECFCTAHEIAVCKWGLERAGDDPELAAEYRQTIAEFEGVRELARAA
jgi:hypothetical protein